MSSATPERDLLRWLARRTSATASAIGAACAMSPGEVRARLASLESRRLIAGRHEGGASLPRRVFYATVEGRRAVGVDDAGRDVEA